MKTVRDFIFLGSKITADGDCSHEIKKCLLLGRKAMTNLDSILKSRDITLPTKVHLFSGSFLFHRVKEDFEEIKVVWKNPGVVALYGVMGRRDEVKCECPSHPPSCLRL